MANLRKFRLAKIKCFTVHVFVHFLFVLKRKASIVWTALHYHFHLLDASCQLCGTRLACVWYALASCLKITCQAAQSIWQALPSNNCCKCHLLKIKIFKDFMRLLVRCFVLLGKWSSGNWQASTKHMPSEYYVCTDNKKFVAVSQIGSKN